MQATLASVELTVAAKLLAGSVLPVIPELPALVTEATLVNAVPPELAPSPARSVLVLRI